VSLTANAQTIQRIEKGASSPISGWVITDQIAQDAARNKDLLEAKEQKILKLEHLRVLDTGDIEHYKQRSKALEDRLHKEETKRFIHTAGAFALGVLLTGIAAKAAIESTR
jgi:hypothetical protein